MKFFVDSRLTKSLSNFLNYRGFDSIHTLDLPDRNSTSDKAITVIAINEKKIMITKDNDFL